MCWTEQRLGKKARQPLQSLLREASSPSPLPAVHDGWMVLPILLLAQNNERLLLLNTHSLCIAGRHLGWSLCLLCLQLWAWLHLSCANICFLLSTLALKEEILCEIQGSSSTSRSSSSTTPACWQKKSQKATLEKKHSQLHTRSVRDLSEHNDGVLHNFII